MLNRRRIRERALQVLFVWDAHAASDAQMASQVAHDLSEDTVIRQRGVEMAQGAWDARDMADKWVERLAPQWPPRRQPGVDRAILRLAVWELTSSDTPPKVVIDEAIELAKIYSTENSPAFVNGVLDAILREHKQLIEGSGQ
jgi:transcription antitermination protein NusB